MLIYYGSPVFVPFVLIMYFYACRDSTKKSRPWHIGMVLAQEASIPPGHVAAALYLASRFTERIEELVKDSSFVFIGDLFLINTSTKEYEGIPNSQTER